jgi:hypothetical protein
LGGVQNVQIVKENPDGDHEPVGDVGDVGDYLLSIVLPNSGQIQERGGEERKDVTIDNHRHHRHGR